MMNLIDNQFAHSEYSTPFQKLDFKWNRSINNTSELVIVTDTMCNNVDKYNNKICWLLESKEITGRYYDYIKNNYIKFNHIFTHDKELLNLVNAIFIPVCGCWIYPQEQKVYEKTKGISIISSGKTQTFGHNLRHEIVKNIRNLDVYGRGYKPVENKLEALKDYRYSIVIENGKYDYYFTEKLIDCFKTGTIPIYWGCPSIGDFFNKEGIISFNSISELVDLMPKLNETFYLEKLKYINENFNISNDYLLAEQHIQKFINKI